MSILRRISEIQDNHCVGCKDPKRSTTYCTTKCTIGKEFPVLGDALLKKEYDLRNKKMEPKDTLEPFDPSKLEPSKENYLYLKGRGLLEKEIRKIFKMGPNNYYQKKSEWGIPRQNRGAPKWKKNLEKAMEDEKKTMSNEEYIAMTPDPNGKKGKESIQNVKLVVKGKGKTYTEEEYFKAVNAALENREKEASEKINSLKAEVITLNRMLFETEDLLIQTKEDYEHQLEEAYEILKNKELEIFKYYRKSDVLSKALKHVIHMQRLQGYEIDPMTAAVMELLE